MLALWNLIDLSLNPMYIFSPEWFNEVSNVDISFFFKMCLKTLRQLPYGFVEEIKWKNVL